jgi:hypothetical protein
LISTFYGLRVPHAGHGLSLQDYLRREYGANPSAGSFFPFGQAELCVLDNDAATAKVGLRLWARHPGESGVVAS